MPKLLSQTHHCRSETRRKEEQKMPRNWSCRKFGRLRNFRSMRNFLPMHTIHHVATVHLSCTIDFLRLLPFGLFLSLFGFLPNLSLVIAFDFGSFCNFAWLGQYISSYAL